MECIIFLVVSFVVERRGSCLNSEISEGLRSTVSQYLITIPDIRGPFWVGKSLHFSQVTSGNSSTLKRISLLRLLFLIIF